MRKELFSHPWDSVIEKKLKRLRSPSNWYPYPLILSFGIVLLLTGHAVFGTSARLGHPAQLLKFPGELFETGGIWFSVTSIDQEIVVTTEDRQVFRWDQNVKYLSEIQPFTDYLITRTKEIANSTALAKTALKKETRAIIAADQRLKYLHFRPILYALAAAKITRYGFETQTPDVEIAADYLKENSSEKTEM